MVEKIYFRVSGRVQGVCFRAYTVSAARDYHVTGWVRNTVDGAVEGEAFGDREALDRFVQWLHSGSPGSRVDSVQVEEGGVVEEQPSMFDIRF